MSGSNDKHDAPGQIDRRGFFRGAAALTVGGLGSAAPALLRAQPAAAPERADAAEQLEEQTQNALRWLGRDPADWVRPRAGVDHNVVIVGGGQSGLSIAYGLKRKGVGRVEIIDRSIAGRRRHLAHDRAHASTAHAEDARGTGARQPVA